ncbi:hypothetical protein [Sulfitobacter pacificus]|uniref:hypothetical protein n=1 Tax=Sulfitobacter pacificus TaxID=1499314 RepID=UPI003101EA5B
MDDPAPPKSNRHKKMFELLRQGDLRPQTGVDSRSAAITARYLDGDAAHRFINRGVTSLRLQQEIPRGDVAHAFRFPFAKNWPIKHR